MNIMLNRNINLQLNIIEKTLSKYDCKLNCEFSVLPFNNIKWFCLYVYD